MAKLKVVEIRLESSVVEIKRGVLRTWKGKEVNSGRPEDGLDSGSAKTEA